MSSIFEKHESPKHEQSIWKNIPIEKLEYVRGILKKVTYCTGYDIVAQDMTGCL